MKEGEGSAFADEACVFEEDELDGIREGTNGGFSADKVNHLPKGGGFDIFS